MCGPWRSVYQCITENPLWVNNKLSQFGCFTWLLSARLFEARKPFYSFRRTLFRLIYLFCKGWIQLLFRGICVGLFVLISPCQGLLIPDCFETQGMPRRFTECKFSCARCPWKSALLLTGPLPSLKLLIKEPLKHIPGSLCMVGQGAHKLSALWRIGRQRNWECFL